MERIVITAYKPFPGKETELERITKEHWSILHKEGLVSDRQPIVCKAQDGTVIEVFGWKSKEAIDQAHGNPAVRRLWEEFGKVCEFVPVGAVEESGAVFSEFTPVT
jgi:hypothetical protein